MSAMKWFRLYSEFCHDPKLATFTKAERYDIIHLFCIASESLNRGSIDLDPKDLAAVLKMTLPKYMAFEEELERKGIAIRSNMSLDMMNWEKRQYEKPSATPKSVSERVRDHREKQRNAKNVTCNAQETPVKQRGNDTDTDTDTDTDKTPKAPMKTQPPHDPDSNASLIVEREKILSKYPWWGQALEELTPFDVRVRIRYQATIWRNWQENPEKAPPRPKAPTEEQIRTEVTKEVFHTVPKNPDESYEQYMERTSSIMAKRCRERANEAMAKYPDYIDVSGSMNRQRVAA